MTIRRKGDNSCRMPRDSVFPDFSPMMSVSVILLINADVGRTSGSVLFILELSVILTQFDCSHTQSEQGRGGGGLKAAARGSRCLRTIDASRGQLQMTTSFTLILPSIFFLFLMSPTLPHIATHRTYPTKRQRWDVQTLRPELSGGMRCTLREPNFDGDRSDSEFRHAVSSCIGRACTRADLVSLSV
jgi:hypothetical protein